MRFVTVAMTSRIDQDQSIFRPESSDITTIEPIFQATCEPMLKHQGRAGALDLIMDLDSSIVRVWHFTPSACFTLIHQLIDPASHSAPQCEALGGPPLDTRASGSAPPPRSYSHQWLGQQLRDVHGANDQQGGKDD